MHVEKKLMSVTIHKRDASEFIPCLFHSFVHCRCIVDWVSYSQNFSQKEQEFVEKCTNISDAFMYSVVKKPYFVLDKVGFFNFQ